MIGPAGLVMQSAYSSIYIKVKDYRNKIYVGIEYKWEKTAAALISTSSCYQVPQQTRTGLANYHLLHCLSLKNAAAQDVPIDFLKK